MCGTLPSVSQRSQYRNIRSSVTWAWTGSALRATARSRVAAAACSNFQSESGVALEMPSYTGVVKGRVSVDGGRVVLVERVEFAHRDEEHVEVLAELLRRLGGKCPERGHALGVVDVGIGERGVEQCAELVGRCRV